MSLAFTSLLQQKHFYLFSRQLHLSNILGYGPYTYFNIHKNVTDPKRQDPDYFEKEADKLPLDEEPKQQKSKKVEDLPLVFCDYIMLALLFTTALWPFSMIIRNKSNKKEEKEYIYPPNQYLNERPTFNYFAKKSSEKKFGGKEIIAIIFIILSWLVFLFPVQIKLLLWEALEGNVKNDLYYFEEAMKKMKEKVKEN
uniref:Uncharacterized protein n=1 Tax=Meloidogyne hapla TaxID=6305 RepID=A0A1I8BT77_MELHA